MSTHNIVNDAVESLRESRFERRRLLKTIVAGGAAALGASALGSAIKVLNPAPGAVTDADVLNFALNLEYLEAEYYLRATTGQGLGPQDTGIVPALWVMGGRQVPFQTRAFQEYAEEIADDELAHVRFLRAALGSAAVRQPAIDIGDSFNVAAQAAGIGPSFDPYENEVNFLIGAFVFEDVGVTAYKGGAPLIQSKVVLEAAAGILGVEAYHAGTVRTLLSSIGGAAVDAAQKISDLRDALDGPDDLDQGVTDARGKANIVPTDEDSIVFSRDTNQVLSIVYFGGQGRGGFFPRGLNGVIR